MWAHQKKTSPRPQPGLQCLDTHPSLPLSLPYQPPCTTLHHPYQHQISSMSNIGPLSTPPYSTPLSSQGQPPSQHTHPSTTTQYHPPVDILYQLIITKYYQTPSMVIQHSILPKSPTTQYQPPPRNTVQLDSHPDHTVLKTAHIPQYPVLSQHPATSPSTHHYPLYSTPPKLTFHSTLPSIQDQPPLSAAFLFPAT